MNKILVTGANGMIGSLIFKRLIDLGFNVIGVDKNNNNNKEVTVCDLNDVEKLEKIFAKHRFVKVIHLAALAHRKEKKDYSFNEYNNANYVCSKNLFDVCSLYNSQVLFISTVDVFGKIKSVASTDCECCPVSNYAKTKYSAEKYLKNKCKKFDIFRLSPVYSNSLDRDIRKRIYLKYPKIAYLIGKGNSFEVLNIDKAVESICKWCKEESKQEISIIKDEKMLNAREYIRLEKEKGRARFVFRIPVFIAALIYKLSGLLRLKNINYLVFKALYPLHTK